MHKEPETLGEILKTARMRADITMETLAERVDITERYLYRIENEGKKPSFDVLYKLIRELAIPADSIFYPEKPSKDSEIENLVRMLYGCNERSMEKPHLKVNQKNNHKAAFQKTEPMICEVSHRSSALRLCVRLFDDNYIQIFNFDQTFLLAFRTVERKIL
mgnify:CR=1 FL=1